MVHRIQKTIIGKFLDLMRKEQVSEDELRELYSVIEVLYSEKRLLNSDIYRHKLELIRSKLKSDLEVIGRKRVNKFLSIEISKDFKLLLESDLDGIEYGNTNLNDLIRFDSDQTLEISRQSVAQVLENIVVLKRRLTSEADLEKFLFDQFSLVFGKDSVHRQYSVGGFLALKTDIDIGNGQVGIELKIAENLSASEMQRLIGQAIYYKKRFYDQNLIVAIVGRNQISSSIRELTEFIDDLGVTVCYISAINW